MYCMIYILRCLFIFKYLININDWIKKNTVVRRRISICKFLKLSMLHWYCVLVVIRDSQVFQIKVAAKPVSQNTHRQSIFYQADSSRKGRVFYSWLTVYFKTISFYFITVRVWQACVSNGLCLFLVNLHYAYNDNIKLAGHQSQAIQLK